MRWRSRRARDPDEALWLLRRSTEEFEARNRTQSLADVLVSSANPEAAFARAEEREQLMSRIAALPKQESLVLTLFFVEELTVSEIAEVLDLPRAAVDRIRMDALRRLEGSSGSR